MSKIAKFYQRGRAETPEERKLIRKLDLTLLPIICLMYWSNYLNRTNYQYAYVSGMANDLGFTGNDFTLGNTLFTVGYTVAQIPHSYLVTRLPARYYFSTCAVIWSVLGCCLSATNTPQQVWAIRFLIALFEAVTFSGSQYLLASWYKEVELGKRAALFASSAQLGSLFSGVLQGAVVDNLNGVHGRAGWRYAYIIDGVIGLGIALAGFLLLPSAPEMGGSPWITAEELQLAQSRLARREVAPFTPRNVLNVILSWKYAGFCILFTIGSQLEAYGFNGIVPQWLATLVPPVSVADRSYYALGLTAVAIVATWLAGIATDVYGRRYTAAYPMALGMLISAAIILHWNVPVGALYFAFYLGGVGYIGQGVFFAWANESSTSDLQRSITLFSMNLFSNALTAWYILLIWPVTTAPRFQRGMISTLVIAPFIAVWASGLRYIELRGRRLQRAHIAEHSSSNGALKNDLQDEGAEPMLETARKAPSNKF